MENTSMSMMPDVSALRVGVLALQGGFTEHQATLNRMGVPAVLVRTQRDCTGLTHLIIPGGESTAMARLLARGAFYPFLRDKIRHRDLAVWGTCAGLILLAKQAQGLGYPTLGVMDMCVSRNAFGAQIHSFSASLTTTAFAVPFEAVFIRAPEITTWGEGVQVLARLGKRVVAVQQGHCLATAFHPELTGQDHWHRYFLSQSL